MKINTGCKTFDNQASYGIMTGNVVTDTQLSWYIRAYNETECNGRINPPGYLQDFDLDAFKYCYMPWDVKEYIKKTAIDDCVIVYNFFHYIPNKNKRYYEKRKKEINHGWVITDENHKLLKYFIIGESPKSYSIIQECIKHITKQEDR